MKDSCHKYCCNMQPSFGQIACAYTLYFCTKLYKEECLHKTVFGGIVRMREFSWGNENSSNAIDRDTKIMFANIFWVNGYVESIW